MRLTFIAPVLAALGCASSPKPKTTYADEIGGTTGWPICDEYLWKFKACGEHESFPEGQREMWKSEYAKYREAWHKVPSLDPETEQRIVEACTTGVREPQTSIDNMCPNVFF